MRALWRRTWASASRWRPSTPEYDEFLQRPRSAVRRRAARRHRGESAGAPARRHVDGALEQVGRNGADHGQQERTGGRLLHAVRRYVRRPGGHQRRAQDAGLFFGAGRQLAASRRDSGKRFRKAALSRIAAESERHAIRSRPTKFWTRFCAPTWKTTVRRCKSRRSSICRSTPWPDIVNKVDRNEYKRQQAAPGLKVTSKAFGIGRRFPIAQKYTE